MASPTGAKSNMRNGSPPSSARTPATTMLGEVPISVVRPPSSDAKAIGIRKTEAETFERSANWKAIGIMIASAPMFLTKADITPTTMTSRVSWARTPLRFGARRLMAYSVMPERATPALTSSAEPTMMTMSLLKPVKAASSGTMPRARPTSNAPTATMS